MLRIVLGRTGSGKTKTITEDIRRRLSDADRRVCLIVPEQQLFSVERELLPTVSPSESKRFLLTSFTKLCDSLEETYGGRSLTTLTNASSALLMWMTLRQLSGTLKTYHSVPKGDVALTRMMLDTTRELTANGILPEQLESASKALNPNTPLSQKLSDVALVTLYYRSLVEELCGNNPADRLLRACEIAEKHAFFRDMTVFVDSFTSFTAQEYQMLSTIMTASEELTISLGLDDPSTTLPHFDSLKDTYRRLNGLARKFDIDRRVLKLEKAEATDALSFLEANLWDYSASPAKRADEPSPISLITASQPYEEAEAAALHILELREQGYTYDEIAVVVRDVETWKGILNVALEKYHIPYFLSEKTDLNTKPAARLLLLALRCISRHYQIGDVMSLCKTGLCGITLRDLDYFEEYTSTWHLSGKRLTEDTWNMNPNGYTAKWSDRSRVILDAANRVKDQVMTPLMTLEVGLKGASSVTDQCKALYEYLCALSVKQQLSEQGKVHLSLGNPREAGEAVRLWSFINEALSTLASVSDLVAGGNLPLSPDELCSALSLIYAETDIGSVPQRHDCIMIGAADTFRMDNVRASLILGLCEGEFPRAVKENGLFTEQDKNSMASFDICFSSREDQLTSEELLYVYRAFTKPSERLFLLRSLAGTDGKERAPSAAFTRITYLFPHVTPTHFTTSYLSGENTARYSPESSDTLSPSRTYALLGEEMWLSRSKLQRFAHCPYSYYGAYFLHLREQAIAKVDNQISGLFLHHVLEVFLRRNLDEHGVPTPMTTEEMAATADEIISTYLSSINPDPHLCHDGRFLHLFDRLRAIALVLIEDMMADLFQSSFVPVGFEWDTHGYKPEDPMPMILPLREETEEEADLPVGVEKGASVLLKMGGVVDRVDVYRTADHKRAYIRIVDYKSSKHELSETTLTKNMDIQLLLYLFTLCSDENRRMFADEYGVIPEVVLPAEALYISPAEDKDTGAISTDREGLVAADEEVLRAISRGIDLRYLPDGLKMGKDGKLAGRALCSEERIQALEQLLRDTIRTHATEMYSGNAHRTPSADSCKFCNMRNSCPTAVQPAKY